MNRNVMIIGGDIDARQLGAALQACDHRGRRGITICVAGGFVEMATLDSIMEPNLKEQLQDAGIMILQSHSDQLKSEDIKMAIPKLNVQTWHSLYSKQPINRHSHKKLGGKSGKIW